MIKEVQHNSSMIKGSSYNEETRTLTVRFMNDSEYVYDEIEPEVYERFVSAESTGRAFNENIKSRVGAKIEK